MGTSINIIKNLPNAVKVKHQANQKIKVKIINKTKCKPHLKRIPNKIA
jgi:hypothetical protein